MSLAGVFTRREAASMTTSVPGTDVFAWSQLPEHKDGIDVLILCGGSKDDLPQQGPEMAALFNTVDSFDTHATIPEYFAAVDAPARAAGTTAIISTGRSEEHTSELQSRFDLVCRLLLEKKKAKSPLRAPGVIN